MPPLLLLLTLAQAAPDCDWRSEGEGERTQARRFTGAPQLGGRWRSRVAAVRTPDGNGLQVYSWRRYALDGVAWMDHWLELDDGERIAWDPSPWLGGPRLRSNTLENHTGLGITPELRTAIEDGRLRRIHHGSGANWNMARIGVHGRSVLRWALACLESEPS